MSAIAKNYPLDIALTKAINAGVDMFIVANQSRDETGKIVRTIARLIRDGKVKTQTIDEAYQRIRELKKRAGVPGEKRVS